MRLGGLIARLAGGEIDAPLRGPLAVAFLQAIVEGGQASFLGLWALRVLHASQAALGVAFGLTAIAGVIAGYLAGHASDRVGRRVPMLLGSAGLPLFGLPIGFVRGNELLGFALMIGLGASGGTLLAVGQALLADLAPPDRRDHAFAYARVTQNLGFVVGPLLGALLLSTSWRALFVGMGILAAVAFAIAIRVIPPLPTEHEQGGPRGSIAVLARDTRFVVALVAGMLATIVYVSCETLLPISLVESHGYAPRTWGLLLVINPVAVITLQVRLTAAVGRVPEVIRLAVGVAAMATPFLLVSASSAIPLVAVLLLAFTLGEMLWAPPSQSLLLRIAPDQMRGAYLGAAGASVTAAFALGPFLGLQVRSALGDTAMWISIGVAGGLAIALYVLIDQRVRRDASPS